MNYFVLTQKKERGCPLGMLNASLYDKFYNEKQIDKIEHGEFNWYAGNGYKDGVRIFDPLSEGLCLISKDKLYDFDIRALPHRLYYISDIFLNLCRESNVEFESCVAIDVKNRRGGSISEKKYYAARLISYSREAAVNEDQSEFFEHRGDLKIRRLSIKSDFDKSLFKLRGFGSNYDAVFCSSDFKEKALQANVKGVDFADLNPVSWPGIRLI